MKKIVSSLMLTAFAAAYPVSAKPHPLHTWPDLGVETQIVFPTQGAIRNFEPDGNDGLWLEDRQRRWYYAEIAGDCQELNFAQAIGFDTRGALWLDRFSAILVNGERCLISSLMTAEKPLPRKERLRLRKEVVAKGRDAVAPSN